ncbi:hypothetical protein ABT354_13105 [Streptomyces sp. NPDC000594]|uniref:hypothetical protein n=1 Tax=Streptomyces sp. NPDC000594 TaxID=3154261 RepID=UPI003324FF71
MRFAAPLSRALVPSALCATVVLGVTGPAVAAASALPPDTGSGRAATAVAAADDVVPAHVRELLAHIAAVQSAGTSTASDTTDLADLAGAAGIPTGGQPDAAPGRTDSTDDALADYRGEVARLVLDAIGRATGATGAAAPQTATDLPGSQDALAAALAGVTDGGSPTGAAPASPSDLSSLSQLGGLLGQSAPASPSQSAPAGLDALLGQLSPASPTQNSPAGLDSLLGQLSPAAPAQNSPAGLGSFPLLGQPAAAPQAQSAPSGLASVPLLGQITELIQAASATS